MTPGPNLAGLLETLDRHGVEYLVAGSVAALAHGAPAATPGDLDVVPATDAENLGRLAAALRELDASAAVETGAWQTDEHGDHQWVEDGIERQARPLDPHDADTFDHSFATPLGRLDLVPTVAGTFAELRARAALLRIAGREAWVAHPLDLLAGMTAARRPKDRARVRHLRSLASDMIRPRSSGTA